MDKFKIQDIEYSRPYHHFLDLKNCSFTESLGGYGLEYYSYVSYIVEYIDNHIKNHGVRNVAEVGCGDGKILYELSHNKNIGFEGYDLSKKAIMFAKAYSEGMDNLNFYDFEFGKSNKKYDVILCVEVLEHISDKDTTDFISQIYNNLADDGILLLSVPSKNIALGEKHYRHYDESMIYNIFSDRFTVCDIVHLHNIKSVILRFLSLLCYNPIYILNNKNFQKLIFDCYRKNYQITTKKNSAHIFTVLKK